MPAAVPFVTQAAAAIIVSSFGLGAVGSAIVYGASALVGGLLHRELMGSDTQATDLDVLRLNQIATNRTMPLIYGSRLIGSTDVFIEGDNSGDYLWIVSVLGEGEAQGIDQVEWTDDEGTSHLVDAVYIDGKIWRDEVYDGIIDYWFFEGTPSQTVLAQLRDNTRGEEEDKYDDNLRNTCYMVYRIQFDRELFSNVPRREVVVKGLKVLDYRTTTVGWSQNPALILYDYLTNTRYGLGWDTAKLDVVSWTETANYCDAKGWKVNFIFSSKMKSQVIIDTILGHFRGFLIWYDGSLYLKYMDSLHGETPVFTIQDHHIARDENGKALVTISHPSRFSTPDALSVSYVDKRNNWTVDTVTVGNSSGQIRQVDFMGFTDKGLAIEMGTYTLERQRLNRSLSFILRPDTVLLDPNDLVWIYCSELGLSQQEARIKSSVLQKDGLVSVTAILDGSTLYNQTYEEDDSHIYESNLPSITDEIPSIIVDSIEEHVYVERGRSFTRLLIRFHAPPDYLLYKGADIYFAVKDGNPPERDEFAQIGRFKTDVWIYPVQEGEVYYIKFLTVAMGGTGERRQDWDDGFPLIYSVEGVSRDDPKCPTYLKATIGRESVELYTNRLDDPDIAGYEFRKGPTGVSWQDSVYVSRQSKPSISWDSIVPGSYTFWVNTRHTNGYYCPNPVSYDIEVPVPPNSTKFYEYPLNFNLGTRINTDSLAGGTQLKRSSSGSSLIGTYITELISIPNERADNKCLMYVKGEYTASGAGHTWLELAPVGMDWRGFAYYFQELRWKRWEELFGSARTSLPGRLEIEAEYWNAGSSSNVYNLEMLTAVIFGDSIQITITITDPNDAAFLTLSNYVVYFLYVDESLLISA